MFKKNFQYRCIIFIFWLYNKYCSLYLTSFVHICTGRITYGNHKYQDSQAV